MFRGGCPCGTTLLYQPKEGGLGAYAAPAAQGPWKPRGPSVPPLARQPSLLTPAVGAPPGPPPRTYRSRAGSGGGPDGRQLLAIGLFSFSLFWRGRRSCGRRGGRRHPSRFAHVGPGGRSAERRRPGGCGWGCCGWGCGCRGRLAGAAAAAAARGLWAAARHRGRRRSAPAALGADARPSRRPRPRTRATSPSPPPGPSVSLLRLARGSSDGRAGAARHQLLPLTPGARRGSAAADAWKPCCLQS